MAERVFITSSYTATFLCPQCNHAWIKDVSQFIDLGKKVTLNCKCPCGHTFPIVLEKRKCFRKPVNLPGIYHAHGVEKEIGGNMLVLDISQSGLKLKLNVPQELKIGDRLEVEFHLDDHRHSHIKKQAIIKSIKSANVSLEFIVDEPYAKALGFYMMK